MNTIGFAKGILQKYNTSNPYQNGNFYDFRKLLRDYFNELHVAFADLCCPDSNGGSLPLRVRVVEGEGEEEDTLVVEYFDGTEWVELSVLNSQGSEGVPFIPQGAQEGISEDGDLSVDGYLSTVVTDDVEIAVALPDGTVVGQLKKILLETDGGFNVVITPDNGTVVALDDAGDYVVYQWNGSAWVIIENVGGLV